MECYSQSNSFVLDIIKQLGNSNPNQQQIDLMDSLLSIAFSQQIQKLTFHKNLTSREAACLYLTAQGKTSQQIAEILSIKPVTVDSYRKEIKRKLKCETMAHAVFTGICINQIPTFSTKKKDQYCDR